MLGHRRPTHTWLSWGFGNGLRWSAEGLDSWVRGDPDWPWVMAVAVQTPRGFVHEMRQTHAMKNNTNAFTRKDQAGIILLLHLFIPVNKFWCWVILSLASFLFAGSCTFDEGFSQCDYQQDPYDDFDWTHVNTQEVPYVSSDLPQGETSFLLFLSSTFTALVVPMYSFICLSNTWQKEILHFVSHYIHLAAILNGIFLDYVIINQYA